MKTKTQTFKCNTNICQEETVHSVPAVTWLQVEIIACKSCGQLIAFSSKYNPKKLVRNTVKLP